MEIAQRSDISSTASYFTHGSTKSDPSVNTSNRRNTAVKQCDYTKCDK